MDKPHLTPNMFSAPHQPQLCLAHYVLILDQSAWGKSIVFYVYPTPLPFLAYVHTMSLPCGVPTSHTISITYFNLVLASDIQSQYVRLFRRISYTFNNNDDICKRQLLRKSWFYNGFISSVLFSSTNPTCALLLLPLRLCENVWVAFCSASASSFSTYSLPVSSFPAFSVSYLLYISFLLWYEF